MKYLIQLSIIIFLLIYGCVKPPEYSDGLLENIPAVVNESDYFSLSILGDDYTDNKEWDLLFSMNSANSLLTTVIVKDVNIAVSDSNFLYLINDLGDTVFNAFILNDFIFTSLDSLNIIGNPKKVIFDGEKFTGRLEYQMIINN